MPDVAPCPSGALQAAVVGILYLQQDAFGSRYLIRAHHHQVLVGSEYAILGQDIQQGFLGQKGLGEILQVVDDVVFGICPIAGKLKRVALGFHPHLLLGCFLHMGVSGGVAVILGKGAVADDEQLHIVEQAIVRPKRFTSVTVNLVERFLEVDASALQLHMHQGQSVHKDGHIVSVLGCATRRCILIQYLYRIIMNIALVDKADVLCLAIVQQDIYDGVTLYAFGLVFDVEIFIGYLLCEQAFPFCIAQADAVQLLQLHAEIIHQPLFVVDVQAFVALCHQLTDKAFLQRCFALVTHSVFGMLLVAGHHHQVTLLNDNIETLNHVYYFSKVNNFSR